MKRLMHLASFVANLPDAAIPAAARELATLALVDFTAAAVAGAGEPVSRIVVKQLGGEPAGAPAHVIGHAMRARAVDAALANGVIGHALDFDDSNMVLGGHPSVTLFPALFALAQVTGRSGADVLNGYVVGFEVMMALAHAVNFDHYEKGWHPTATLGAFAATAAASRMLGLDETQSAAALGLAASMSSGIKANFGSMAKPLQVGEASRRGVMCAELAAQGCTASDAALEGRQGFLNVYNGAGNYRAEAIDALGDGFEILRSGIKFKKYSCCGSTHAPVDAAIALRSRHGIDIDAITEVRVGLNARRRPHVDRPVVKDSLAAKFSVQYTVAAALIDGEIRLRHFSDAAVERADIQSLMARVRLDDLAGAGDSLGQGCEVAVRAGAGDPVSIRLADAEGRGSGDYVGYMRDKFMDCVGVAFEAADAEDLFDALLTFETASCVDDVMSRLSGGQGRRSLRADQ